MHMNKQLELLNEIYYLLSNHSPKNFDSLIYVYKFNPQENWIGTTLLTVVNGKNEALNWCSDILKKIKLLCKNLHQEMQKHTGGDWRKVVLHINENKEVKTNFIYDIQSYKDPLEQEDEK